MKRLKLDRKVKYTYTEEDKKKIKSKEMKPYIKYFKRYSGLLVLCAFLMIIQLIVGLIVPIITGRFIASLTENFDANVSLTHIYYILGFSLHVKPVNYLVDTIWTKCAAYVRYDLNTTVVNRINEIKILCFDNNKTSKFTSRMFTDVNKVSIFPLNIMNYIMGIISKLGFISYTFSLSLEIGLYMIGYIVISIVIDFARYNMRLRHHRVLRNYSEKEDNIQYENIHGMRDIRALNSTENVKEKIDKKFVYAASLNYKYSEKNRIFSHSNSLIKTIVYFFFLYISIRLIVLGRLDIAAFIIAYNYHGSVSGFASNIISIKAYYSEVLLCASRLNELFDDSKFPSETFGDTTLTEVKGKIQFKNVNFKYTNNVPVLEDVDFTIHPNTIVSFVGKSGSGKSTIALLLSKLYFLEENSGDIFLDDKNINSLTKETIRNNICLVSQSPYIFDMTIAENLKLAKPDASHEEMDDVLKKTELYDFVYSCPDKLDTRLGENGIKLSGGQKQRLAISRALLKDAKIIVFDEATSALDNENQAKIKDVMKRMVSNHTIVMIAHRLSTVVDSDNIIYIQDGRVHAQGTHTQLMKDCKEYRDLYKQEEKNAKIEQG